MSGCWEHNSYVCLGLVENKHKLNCDNTHSKIPSLTAHLPEQKRLPLCASRSRNEWLHFQLCRTLREQISQVTSTCSAVLYFLSLVCYRRLFVLQYIVLVKISQSSRVKRYCLCNGKLSIDVGNYWLWDIYYCKIVICIILPIFITSIITIT